MANPWVQVSLRMSPELHEQVARLAEARGLSFNGLVTAVLADEVGLPATAPEAS